MDNKFIRVLLIAVVSFVCVLALITTALGGYMLYKDPGIADLLKVPNPALPTANPTPTSAYPVPSPDQMTQGPGQNVYDQVQTAVPTEMRYQITLSDLLGGVENANMFWSDVTFVGSTANLEGGTAFRTRSADVYLKWVHSENIVNKLLGVNGDPIPGGTLTVMGTSTVFLSVGTNPSQILWNTDVTYDDTSKTVYANVTLPMKSLAVGIPISDAGGFDGETFVDPQIQAQGGIITDYSGLGKIVAVFKEASVSEVELSNIAEGKAMKEALWMLLNTDETALYEAFRTSVEETTVDPGRPYLNETIKALVKQAICEKIDWEQKILIEKKASEGITKVDKIDCTQVNVVITVKAKMPECPDGSERVACITTIQRGNFILNPYEDYSVSP